MSTNPPRRRRIAGERRPNPVPGADEETTTDRPVPDAPVTPVTPVTPPPSGYAGPSPTTDIPGGPAPAGTAAPSPGTPGRPRRDIPLAVLAGLAVLTLVLVGVAAWLGLVKYDVGKVRQASAVEETIRTAPAAAERAAASILSYSFTSLDADKKAAQGFMTDDYAATYGDTFDTLVVDDAERLHAKVEADVRASSVTEAGDDRATVLLFVNQSTTSKANGGEPRQALNRVAFDMVREGDTWLVDDIRAY